MRLSRLVIGVALVCTLTGQTVRERAEQLMAAGVALKSAKSAPDLHKAGAYFEEAAGLWGKLVLPEKEIEALYSAAWTHYPLREFDAMEPLLSKALDIARKGDFPAARAELLSSLAVVHNQQGRHEKAIEEYAEARDIQLRLGHAEAARQLTTFQAGSWRMRAAVAEKANNVPAALEAHRQAAALFELAQDSKAAASDYVRLGQICRQLGTRDGWLQAAGYFEKAIPLLESASDATSLAIAWSNLGAVRLMLGQAETARAALLKALPLLNAMPNPRMQGLILNSLASAEETLNNPAEAAAYYERALQLFSSAHDVQSLYIAGMKLGKMDESLGRKREALEAYQVVAKATHDSGNRGDEAVALQRIAVLNIGEKNWAAALDNATAAQKLHAELGDKGHESLDWALIGSIHESQGHYREKLRAALRQSELAEGGDTRSLAQALIAVADAYNALHQSSLAIKSLERARTLAENDAEQKAVVLVELGEVNYELSRLGEARDLQNQALALALKLEKPYFVAKIRNDLGLTLQALGETQTAKKIFEQNLAEARARKDDENMHVAMHNLARLDQDSGDSRLAIQLYEESLSLSRSDDTRASTLAGLGMAYHYAGQDEKSLATLNRSLSEWRALGDQDGEATVLNDLALVYSDLSRPQQAIDAMNEALSKKRTLADDAGVASILQAFGGIYQQMGDYDRAEAYFNEALEILNKFDDQIAQALVHHSLGVLEMNRHEPARALRQFDQVSPVLEKFGRRDAQVTLLSNEGNALLGQRQLQDAEAKFQQAIVIAGQIQNSGGKALALHGLGSVYEAMGRLDLALATYRRSLEMWCSLQRVDGQSKALSLISRVERKQAKLEAAIKDATESVRLLESQRSTISSEDLRAYYVASMSSPYDNLITALMDMHRTYPKQGWDVRAFEASENARARSLLDLLTQSHANPKGVDTALLASDRAAERDLTAKAAQLQKTAADSADHKRLQLEIEELTAERERNRAAIRAASGNCSTLTPAQPLTLSQIRNQVLDGETILLDYVLGEERSYLFVVTRDAFTAHELAKRGEMESAARDLSSDLEAYQPDRTDLRGHATALSKLLLQPIATEIGDKRLVIVASGELAQVPFAMLPAPSTGQPLVTTNEIVTQPSASTLAVIRYVRAKRKKATKELAVIADPVIDRSDERMHDVKSSVPVSDNGASEVLRSATRSMSRDGAGLIRLKHAAEEAQAILALSSPNRSLSLQGFEANKPNVLDGRLVDYRIIHFATHGLADVTHPQLSGLVLSLYSDKGQPIDGFLDLSSIFDMNLSADLVVLSACQTGQGKLVGSEGVVGLTRGFLYAGARGVVASLWSVDDEATSEVMKRFYRAMLGRVHATPAAALRQAQISMLRDSRWQDPYYWAAFTMQGEWR